MRSNFLDQFLGFTCFGESHGKAMGIVIEDILPGIDFPFEQIQEALNQRRPGHLNSSSSRKENDEICVLSGLYEGKTTGLPICIIVYNQDARSQDYHALKEIFRPGHADYSWFQKFKIYDWRGGGRASGRETLSRVIAGSLVSTLTEPVQMQVYPLSIGSIKAQEIDEAFITTNPYLWPDPNNYNELTEYLQEVKASKDSVGAMIQCHINNVKAGLGDPVFKKLDAQLAQSLLSIGGVKGIEFGDGFLLCEMKGSESNDPINSKGLMTNHQGGISGGVSNGQTISFKLAVKAVPSIALEQMTTDVNGLPQKISIDGRHDVCLVPRILPVIKSMIQLCLADALAYQKLLDQESQTLDDYREAIDKIDEDILLALCRRMKISEQIGHYKKQNNLNSFDPQREADLKKSLADKAEILGLDQELVDKIWQLIIEESKRKQ